MTIAKLLKLQIDNKTDALKTKSFSKMFTTIFKRILLIVGLTLLIGFVTFRLTISIGINISEELLSIVLVVLQIISLFFGVGNIITNLYLSKDNEMLMSLPVTPNQLFLSKILLIYLNELVINATISIPVFISLGIFGGMGIEFYLCIPLFILILPLLPLVLASFISLPAMVILKFLRKHIYVSIVLLLTVVVIILITYVNLIGNIAGNFDLANEQIATVKRINNVVNNIGSNIFLFYQLAQAMTSFSMWYWICVYFVSCQIVLILTIFVIRHFYFDAATSNLENSFKEKKEKKYKVRTPIMSLIIKEIKCIFRSPGNIFEFFLFTLLMPFIVVSYDKLLLTAAVNQAGQNMINGSHLMIIAILAMLSNIISATAISRDGGNFYISKIIPTDYYTQVAAKLIFNAIFTVGAVLITMIISFAYQPPLQVVLGGFSVIFVSIGHIAMSLDMDIKKPVLNFQGNEDNSMLQKSTLKSAIIGLLIGISMGAFVILFAFNGAIIFPYIILLIIGIVFCIYRIYLLILRINLQYDKIEM